MSADVVDQSLGMALVVVPAETECEHGVALMAWCQQCAEQVSDDG